MEKLQGSKKIKIQNEAVKTIFEKQQQKAFLSVKSPIRTSNLNYDIFEDVCILLGFDIIELDERYKKNYDRNIEKTINEDLVSHRNNIAHGNYLPINENQYRDLYNVVINGVLFHFKEIEMDAAQSQKYLRKYVPIAN